jgi:hypothetical protein
MDHGHDRDTVGIAGYVALTRIRRSSKFCNTWLIAAGLVINTHDSHCRNLEYCTAVPEGTT